MSIFYFLIFSNGMQPRYYIYSKGNPGELLINVCVWGEIHYPGIYSIPEGTDLATLLTLAGGPTEKANISKIEVIHTYPKHNITIYNFNHFLKTGKKESLPIMKFGDMVRVNKNLGSKIKDLTHFVTEISLLIGVYFQLYNIWKAK